MTYILYGSRRSGSLIVELALAEIGASYEIRDVDGAGAAHTVVRGDRALPLVEINDYPERFSPDPEGAPAVRDLARTLWRERLLRVESSIAGDPFLLPWGYCASDIHIAVVSRWAQQDAWRPTRVPKVEKLTEAVALRPAAAQIWSRHRPAATPGRFS